MQGYHPSHQHHKSKSNTYSSGQLKSSLRLKPKTPLEKQQIIKVNTILTHLFNHADSVDFREPVDYKGLELDDYPQIVQNPMDLGTVSNKLKEKQYKTVQEVLNEIQIIWDNCKLYNPNSTQIYVLADKLEGVFRKMIRNYLPQLKVSSITSAPQRPFLQKPFTIVYKPIREQVQDKCEISNSKSEQKNLKKKPSQFDNSHESIQNLIQASVQKCHPQSAKYSKNLQENANIHQISENSSQCSRNQRNAMVMVKTVDLLEEKKNFVSKLNNLSTDDLQQIITVIQEECPSAFQQLDASYAQIDVEGMDYLNFMKANEALTQILEKNIKE